MRLRREAVVPPPFRRVPTSDAGNLKALEVGWEGLRVGASQGPISPPPLPRRASDPGPLEFLEGTRVGQIPGLAILGMEKRGQSWTRLSCGLVWMCGSGWREKRAGLALPRLYVTSLLFCLFFLFCQGM